MNLSSFQTRIRIVSVFVVFFALILILKLFFVQVIHKNSYSEKADKQYATPSGDIFNRGSIFFSKKDGSLVAAASVSSGFKLAIKAKDIKDEQMTFDSLSQYITLDNDSFISKALKKSDPYEEITNHLTKEQADSIDALKLPGVSIFKDNWRFYPGESLASHTLGFLAFKGDDRVGQYGLERFYDGTLSKPKDEAYVNFFAEVFSNIKSSISNNNNQGDIVTTIEPSTQHTLVS